MIVTILGIDTVEIKSIQRKRDHLIRSLQSLSVDVRYSSPLIDSTNDADIVIDFDHSLVKRGVSFKCPQFIYMHGTVARGFTPYPYEERIAMFKETDTFIVECTSDTAILKGRGLSSIEAESAHAPFLHLPLCVDDAFYPESKPYSRQLLGIDPAKLVVGFVARIHPYKNLHVFLDVFEQLRLNLPLHAIVVGEFETYPYADWHEQEAYNATLRARLTRHIRSGHLTWVSTANEDAHLRTIYSAMDALFHPSQMLDENFGYAPIEAMACGTTVVASAWGGMKDTLASSIHCSTFDTFATLAGPKADLAHAVTLVRSALLKAAILDRTELQRSAAAYSLHLHTRRLKAAIDAATGRKTSHTGRPLAFAHGITVDSFPAETDCAIKIEMGPSASEWRRQRFYSQFYASKPCVGDLRGSTVLYQPFPVVTSSPGVYQIQDPAWPSVVHIEGQTSQALLAACEGAQTIDKLKESTDVGGRMFDKSIASLRELGLLVTQHVSI